jgi:2-hydroxy-6-oxonona-2,4-dienedioate hydrolase
MLTEEGLVRVPGLLSRWIRLPGGARAHYVTSGETGPAVVLLHGGITGSSGTAGWRFMAPFLGGHGFRVYCPDQPAFGLTEGADYYQPGTAGAVDFLEDFVTALALDSFHLGGNSMGCINAVHYVAAHPDRVLSFALIAGSVGDIVPKAALAAADKRSADEKGRGRRRRFDGSAASMRAMMEAITYRQDAIDDDVIEMRVLAANRNAEAFARLVAWRANENPLEQVKLSASGRFDRVPIPGIYLYGRDDIVNPVECGYLQEDALPGIQFFYPGECGHQGQTDQPEMFNQVFLEFFRDGRVSQKVAEWAGVSRRRPINSQLISQETHAAH